MPPNCEPFRNLLQAGETGWRAAIADSFQLRQYLFDSRLRRTEDFADLAFDQRLADRQRQRGAKDSGEPKRSHIGTITAPAR